VTLDDCAVISRHLTRVLAVEGIDYERLEVSSPGLDRRLRKASDFVRFAGQKAELRMRTPDASGRRKFVGVLRGTEAGRVSVELEGQRVQLALDDVDRAKLIPEL
jgi:ribosome maturation factor RimP